MPITGTKGVGWGQNASKGHGLAPPLSSPGKTPPNLDAGEGYPRDQ